MSAPSTAPVPWSASLPLWWGEDDPSSPAPTREAFRAAVSSRLTDLVGDVPPPAPTSRHDVHLVDRVAPWLPVLGGSAAGEGISAAVWEVVCQVTTTGHFRALATLAAERAASQGYVRVSDIPSRVANVLPDVLQSTRERAYLALVNAFTAGEVISAPAEDTARPRVRLTEDAPTLALPFSPVAFRLPRKGKRALIGPVCESCEHTSCAARWEVLTLPRVMMRALFAIVSDTFPRDRSTVAPVHVNLTADGTLPDTIDDTAGEDVPLPLPEDLAARFRDAARVLSAGGHEIVTGNGRVSPRVWEYLSMAHGRGVGTNAVRTTRDEYRRAILAAR